MQVDVLELASLDQLDYSGRLRVSRETDVPDLAGSLELYSLFVARFELLHKGTVIDSVEGAEINVIQAQPLEREEECALPRFRGCLRRGFCLYDEVFPTILLDYLAA